MKTYKIRNKVDGTILEITEDQLKQYGLESMSKGGMIKRKDGSYSKRGLWDSIRANKGSGKKPTKEMLKQEAKIKAEEKAYGGYMQMGGGLTDWFMQEGGIPNNPGFNELPEKVQLKIIDNMASGGCMECGGKMQDGGRNVNALYDPYKVYSDLSPQLRQSALQSTINSLYGTYNKPSYNPTNINLADYNALIDLQNQDIAADKAKYFSKFQQMPTPEYKGGGKIKTDPKGYWNKENQGNPVIIPSNRITMKNVNQPLMGIFDMGDIQYMQPNGEYLFEGNEVLELPLEQAKDGKWIQKATASIKRRGTEGVCTGSKFGSSSCPPGSKRYNLAKTFKKMAKARKKEEGGYIEGNQYEMTDAEIARLKSMGYKIKEV